MKLEINLYRPVLHPPPLSKQLQAHAMKLTQPEYRVTVGYAVFVLVLLFMTLQHFGKLGSAEENLKEMENTLQVQETKVRSLESIKTAQADPEALKEEIEQLQSDLKEKKFLNHYIVESNAVQFSKLLKDVARVIPQGVWLRKIEVRKHADFIKLLGSTWHPTEIVSFVKRMEETPVFKKKVFDTIQIENNQKNNYKIDFLIKTHSRKKVAKNSQEEEEESLEHEI